MTFLFEQMGRSAADVQGHFSRHGIFIGDASYAVGTEKLSQKVTPSVCTSS
jgi:hypothetical protein